MTFQQHAVALGLLAQKFEDEAVMLPASSGGSGSGSGGFSKQKLFGNFRKKKVQVVVSPGNTLQKDADVGLGGAPITPPPTDHTEVDDTYSVGSMLPNIRPVSLPAAPTLDSYAASSPVSVGKNQHVPLSGKNSVSSTMSFGESSSAFSMHHQMAASSTSTLVNNQSPTRDELISTLQVRLVASSSVGFQNFYNVDMIDRTCKTKSPFWSKTTRQTEISSKGSLSRTFSRLTTTRGPPLWGLQLRLA